MSSYADLYARLGAYQAEAARRQGDIWSNFAVNVGQIPLQIQQQALLKAREQRLNQQAASEQQLTDLKLRGEQRAQQEQADVDWVWSQPIWNDETGDFDVQKATKVAQEAGFGHYVPKIIEQGGKWNEEAAKTREAHAKLLDQSRESLGNSAVGLDVTNDGDWQAYNAVAARNQWITRDEANRNISMPPEARGAVKARYIQQSKGATERTKPIERDITKERIDPTTGQVLTPARMDPREAETIRHNLQTEAETRQLRSETARHNLATEAGGDEAIQLTPAALDVTAHQYAMTGQLPPMGMGKKGAAVRTRIINRAAEIYKDLDLPSQQAAFKANQASLTTLQKQRDAIGAFEETAKKNIDIFLNTASKVVDTGSPLLNAPVRMLSAKVLGSPNQAQYDAARQVALSEIAKITSNPNLSGALSDSARHEVAAFNPDTATLKQTVAVMTLLKRDMDNRKSSLDDQLKDIRQRIAAPPGGSTSTPTVSPKATHRFNPATGQLEPIP